MPNSLFYGAAVAALAAGNAPAEYRKQPKVQQRIAELNAYFARERESQPLHNRLMLLWASTKLPDALPEAARRSTIEEIWRKQEADGGWTIDSLGPWKEHPGAPVSKASNSYATGLIASVLEAVDVNPADPRLARALAWLESHQDRRGGYWEAGSMNKAYGPGAVLGAGCWLLETGGGGGPSNWHKLQKLGERAWSFEPSIYSCLMGFGIGGRPMRLRSSTMRSAR